MKILFLFLLMTVTPARANYQLCEYLKVHSFNSYVTKAIPKLSNEDQKLTASLSLKLENQRRKECRLGSVDVQRSLKICTDSCSFKQCEDLCRGYQLFALAFLEGLKARPIGSDYGPAVINNSRDNSKNLREIVDEVSRDSATKQ